MVTALEFSEKLFCNAIKNSNNGVVEIDAAGIYYRDLNQLIRKIVLEGTRHIKLYNVCGQRYIATDLACPIDIEIYGTPGNDLGTFMNGSNIMVYGNAQDGCGNTMNDGKIVVHGHAGDILGMSMRGGKIFIRDDVGYRVAIHMKEYMGKVPVIVIGGTSQDFFGEYMAGGRVVLLGLNLADDEKHKAHFIGTGMHGGIIYIREGTFEEYQLGKEVGIRSLDDDDKNFLESVVTEFVNTFSIEKEKIKLNNFLKLIPVSLRPYGKMYAY